jgi:hypothetical protein
VGRSINQVGCLGMDPSEGWMGPSVYWMIWSGYYVAAEVGAKDSESHPIAGSGKWFG